jgi:Protein ChrB, N-terminal/ChrB, C-terminal domain
MDLWRKLRRFGCLGLNTSAYVLPDIPACPERLDWLAKQVQDAGGEATVSRVSLIEGITDDAIISRFRSQANAEYSSLLKELRNATKKTKRLATAEEASLRKFRRWFDEIRESDYFEADRRHDAEAAITQWEQSLRGESLKALPVLKPNDFQKRTWLTRPRPEIDRCASAWFIRRFVDGSAKFLFADKRTERPKVITFDMLV